MDILDFQSALDQAALLGGKKHLLLGNGFSIALQPNLFQYDSIFEKADFSQLSVDHIALFSSLQTTDFESVMQALKSSATLAEVYATSDKALSQKMLQDAEYLKDILVTSIAKNHPGHPSDITDDQYYSCRKFLRNFSNGHIFTLNYDLLLYWSLMHDSEVDEPILCDDGFRKAQNDTDFIEWNSFNTQNIFYLHGALHLFDRGHTLEKYSWKNTGVRLMDQIRSALDQDRFPLIVSEGDSDQKLTKITHSGYLHRGLRSFESITGSLFIYGHSLADNDDHFFNLLSQSKVKNLFVALHNPDDLTKHEDKFSKLRKYQALRRQRFSTTKNPNNHDLNIKYFDSNSARIWG